MPLSVIAAFIMGIPVAAQAFLAETNQASPEWIGSATQVSAFGLVAWIVYYVLSSWIPKMQEQSTQQLAAQREAHAQAMNELAAAHKQTVDKIADAFQKSLYEQRNDLLTLKGVCPSKPNHVIIPPQ